MQQRSLSFLGLSVVAFGLAVSACSSSQPAPKPVPNVHEESVHIHTVTSSPAGILANAYLIESEHAVVAVDSALTRTDARALRKRLAALQKPLRAVLLTHGHPDHYNGVTELIADQGDVPVYASAAVAQVIRSSDAAKEAQWKPMFGAEWPERRTFPNRTLEDGERVEVDGLAFTLHEVGPGESHADSYWLLDGPRPNVFVGDVVIHGHHAYVSDGHTTAWLENLASLRQHLAPTATLYPGHGEPGGLALLNWQEEYLTTYRGEVQKLGQGADHLEQAEEQELTRRMKARYPDAGLEFLIALGADAVAAELAATPSAVHSRNIGER
jgi:glyoxylase-like metal-dependent hydrolase (beta-lactamase superfamily II)